MMQQRGTFLRMIGQQPGQRGRAALFDPAHGQRIRDLAQQGDFPEAWAAELGVGLSTMRDWIRDHPDFRADVEIAFLLLMTYWTRRMSQAAESPTAKPGLYAMIARRFPAIYGTNPVDLEKWLTGTQSVPSAPSPHGIGSSPSGGAPMASPGDVGGMSSDDLEKQLAALRARRAAEGDGK